MKLILASSSPRRRQLLGLLGLSFDIDPSTVDEIPKDREEPAAFALRAAKEKAAEVAGRHPGGLVLGADTVVEIDGRILGKPRNGEHACEMLRSLSGRTHRVHTGMSLVLDEDAHDLVDTSEVVIMDLDEARIRWYVATGEPLDKAGAYAVQGIAGVMVSGIQGSPNTVIGLPLHRLPELFAAHGIDMWSMVDGG